MSLNVIEIEGKDAFLIRKNTLEYRRYFLNGVELSNDFTKEDFIVQRSDTFQECSKNKELFEYRKDDKVMSISDYKTKPTWYDEDSSDEETLRAIANKKELAGFKPQYKEPKKENVEFNIIGKITDTGSTFIFCTIKDEYYQEDVVLYTLHVQKIAMDEYKKLCNEHKTQAVFEMPDRNYLRFVKINNNYAFGDYYPFGDFNYKKTYLNLLDAKKEEINIRSMVKKHVKKAVFKENLTKEKTFSLINQLINVKELPSKLSMDEMLTIVINDLRNYKNNIV